MVTKSRSQGNKREATVEELYHIPENGKAELVGGRIVRMSPAGAMPGWAATRIAVSLDRNEEQQGGGYAFGTNIGFIVNLPARKSFSPDAAWYAGDINSMKFLNGAPLFAAEVRSEGDYGPKAEKRMARKRRDYFAAGTLVVWDVDLLSSDVVKKYTADNPLTPIVFRRGNVADAEPAMAGWQMPVDALFL